jgi:hypothetical protein
VQGTSGQRGFPEFSLASKVSDKSKFSGAIPLVNFLFEKASEVFDPNDPFACGLSISLMQDSIEAMIWTVIKEYDAPMKPNDSFDKLWNSIPKSEKNKEKKNYLYVQK